jgi:hypothetical protein
MPIGVPRHIPTVALPQGTILSRVHRREHGALWFGPPAGNPPHGRFDAPAGEFGICYFGESTSVAVLEALIRGSRRLLERADLEARVVSTVTVTEPMRFLHFEGPGLAKLGIGAEQAHARDYRDCQRMTLDIFRLHPDVDGVQYRSRWDNSLLCWAVFDRAGNKLGPPRPPAWLGDAVVIGDTLDRYDLGFA